MKTNILLPSRDEADKLLTWAYEQNPGPWAAHCKAVARAAHTIASAAKILDPDRAYVSGILHDIGYYAYKDGRGKTCHIYIGYELMIQKGYNEIAEICLSHSFPYKDIRAYGNPADMNCSDEEALLIANFLTETTYNDYDKLIQLCDCLGTAQGICIIEKRMLSVVRRHGYDSFTAKRIDSFFELKHYFDEMCGINIYSLFHDDISADVFR